MSSVTGGEIKFSAMEQRWGDELKAVICEALGLNPDQQIISVQIGLDDDGNPKWGNVYIDARGWNDDTMSIDDMWHVAKIAKERYARNKELPDGDIGFPPDLIEVIDA